MSKTVSDSDDVADVLRAFQLLRIWARGDRRAPHKPLLVLWALGQWQTRRAVRFPFHEVEEGLRPLLQEFGTGTGRPEPKFPFIHLASDRVWTIQNPGGSTDPALLSTRSVTRLREEHTTGGFSDRVLEALARDPALCGRIAGLLLTAHFPSSLRPDIAASVGLTFAESFDPPVTTTSRRRRDPEFRAAVLRAYERRCAVCSLDLHLGGVNIGLEASHIRWFEAHGPDEVSNGLALCPLHHKVFDLGCFTLGEDLRIEVSQEVTGGPVVAEVLGRFQGQPIRKPIRDEERPKGEHVAWHRREVFKGRPR